jgi:putative glycosyltransferase (TIGR04372 family)
LLPARSRGGLIDYPNTPAKSELMDLYLIKHCRFYIGTTSGILDTAYLFQTPTLSTNATNFDFRSSNKKDRVLFKRVFDRRNSEVLHFKEAIHFYDEIMSPSWSERFDYVENTSEELLDATVEFIDSLSNKKTVTRRQVVARRSLIRKRLSLARKNSEEYSMLSASLAFSRCQIIDSHLK